MLKELAVHERECKRVLEGKPGKAKSSKRASVSEKPVRTRAAA
jgi:hypothetical protein